MFGARRHVPRPVLLILVYGIFLVIVGLTAVTQTALVSADFSATALNSTVSADAALVRLFVTGNLSPDDLGASGPSAERQAALEQGLAQLVRPGQIVRIEVRLPDGHVLAADDPAARGETGSHQSGLRHRPHRPDGDGRHRRRRDERGGGRGSRRADVVREYFPLVTDGQVRAVVGVWRDAAPILASFESIRRNIILLSVSAGLIAAIVLYLVFRSAQGRITRQTKALLDAAERIP